MDGVTYRRVHGVEASQKEWDRIELLLASRGWASLNRQTTLLIIAERDGEMLGFNTFQLYPHVGPLYLRPSARGTGLAEELSDKMVEFLFEIKTRGWMVIADSPHSAKLCEDRGMTKIESPVFVMSSPGGIGGDE